MGDEVTGSSQGEQTGKRLAVVVGVYGQPAPTPEEASPPVKKTRSRKKSETKTPATPTEQGSVSQAESGGEAAPAPPKRGRLKKSVEVEARDGETAARQMDAESLIPKPPPKRKDASGNQSPNDMLLVNQKSNLPHEESICGIPQTV
ncbi:hypothetical protein KSF_087790 [Reticulibacter mediterranei]|uniref:Uncharacterized protein n=1 Tax=Reticulibacter mediterranei TaxID=2778369 RepID=A0A8J3IZ73_9CHLR|nr:hypothetical protein [Reticulibacter mediterranei]GHO98731.1 hypothetical protein KSF_087790 [Reticulibacter mediterranei]